MMTRASRGGSAVVGWSSMKMPRRSRLLLWFTLLRGISASFARSAAADPAPVAELAVPGHGAALVAEPTGGPRPLLVATHGSFDRPDWHCETWRRVFAAQLFVLCPRGVLRWDTPKEPDLMRYYYRSSEALEREIDAGVSALRARHGDRVARAPMIYLGFSQGAIYGAPLLLRRAADFPAAVLVEGGSGFWTAATARAYARAGGRRVLFACGQARCEVRARAAARILEQAGVSARVVSAPTVGHHYDGAVAAQIETAVEWLRAPTAP